MWNEKRQRQDKTSQSRAETKYQLDLGTCFNWIWWIMLTFCGFGWLKRLFLSAGGYTALDEAPLSHATRNFSIHLGLLVCSAQLGRSAHSHSQSLLKKQWMSRIVIGTYAACTEHNESNSICFEASKSECFRTFTFLNSIQFIYFFPKLNERIYSFHYCMSRVPYVLRQTWIYVFMFNLWLTFDFILKVSREKLKTFYLFKLLLFILAARRCFSYCFVLL